MSLSLEFNGASVDIIGEDLRLLEFLDRFNMLIIELREVNLTKQKDQRLNLLRQKPFRVNRLIPVSDSPIKELLNRVRLLIFNQVRDR